MAIGKFDGLHLGHREVLRGCDTVCTFDPHPLAVLRPDAAPRLLTDVARRAELAAALGVRELVVLRFDDAMRRRSPEAFVDEILVAQLGAIHVSVGENFRFGHRAQGTPELLRADGRFGVRVAAPVTVDGAAVSSTRVRAVLAAGAVAEAAMLLGAPHALRCATAAGTPG
ncbi:MAG TPA: FAD synthetase family protein, partial [Solirubrobacteraceae bacterium]|nr:FAD synthetase family protein [Solirubrobacteraceae bacterium]